MLKWFLERKKNVPAIHIQFEQNNISKVSFYPSGHAGGIKKHADPWIGCFQNRWKIARESGSNFYISNVAAILKLVCERKVLKNCFIEPLHT